MSPHAAVRRSVPGRSPTDAPGAARGRSGPLVILIGASVAIAAQRLVGVHGMDDDRGWGEATSPRVLDTLGAA